MGDVGLGEELERVAELVAAQVGPGAAVSGILATEAGPGKRVYLCSVDEADGTRSWLAVDGDASPIPDRASVPAGSAT